MWEQLSSEMRQTFVFNAPTWLDEMNDPSWSTLDLERLATFHHPAIVSQGDQSPPFFGVILDRLTTTLPHAQRNTFYSAGHIPHLTHPDEFVRIVGGFIGSVATARWEPAKS